MKILLDKDGVMYNLYDEWYGLHNQEYGHIHQLTVKDVTSWNTQAVCDSNNCPAVIESYFNNPKIWIDGQPFDGAIDTTQRWVNSGHDIVVITTVANAIATKPSWDWLNIYFPHIPNIMMVTGHIKHWAIADVLIDDGIHNHAGFQGISILFDRPWNQDNNTLIRARGWDHLDKIINRADELLTAYRKDMFLSTTDMMMHKWTEGRIKREVEEGL